MMSPRNAASLRLPIASVAVIATLALGGCVTGGPRLVTPEPPPIPQGGGAIPSSNVAVLSDGNQVVANTAEGKMKIEAGPGLRRVFNWDGLRRGVITKPRSEGFAGSSSKGITFEGTPSVWADAKGIKKVHYEEGRRSFENVDDAMIWMQIRRLYFTYNNQGLVLGWKHEGDTLHVELWQFYIDGQQPTALPDSHDSDITEGKLVVEPQKMFPHLVFDDGHTEPYDASTAGQYNPRAASSGTASKASSSCNWFQRLFKQCTEASSTAPDETAGKTTAPAAATSTPADNTASNDNANNSAEQNKPDTTSDLPKAKIKGSTVNIRSKATTHSDVLFQAKEGDQLKILKEDKGWRYVEFDDGRKGWVADFLLNHE